MTIKQRTPNDCAVCCLAMALNMTYEQFNDRFRAFVTSTDGKGARFADIEDVLKASGAMYVYDYMGETRNYRPFGMGETQNYRPSGRAILVVRSLNEMGLHMVYFDGTKIQDPTNRDSYEGTDVAELKPLASWTLN